MKIARVFSGVLAGLMMFAAHSAWAKPKQVLVVTVTKGFRHSSIPTAERVLGEIAKASGAFTVDYVCTDEEMAVKMTAGALGKYDGIIFANTTGELPLPDKQAFLDWIKSGRGFIGMHSATDTYRGKTPLDPYVEMIGGEFKSHPRGLQDVECLVQDKGHPSCRHFGDAFQVKDEIYILNGFRRDTVHGLLWLDKHPGDGTPGDYPVAWCKKYGKGRVFYTSLGHAEAVWENAAYQQHILGGIKWALGLEKGDATPQGTAARLSRAEAREGFKPLFNGDDLTGWRVRRADRNSGWSAQNGMLVNLAEKGQGTDFVSEASFRDFTVRYDYMIVSNGNSGFYLRGRHEIQILDDHAAGVARDNGNGGIYKVATPAQFVSRPAGEWQSVEATIIGDRLTVTLNGVKIHDNVLMDKPTGGALDADAAAPGPIMLQGDHGPVAFRNMRIKTLKSPAR